MYSCAMTVMSMNLDGASCWHLFLVRHSLQCLFLGACDEQKNILQKQHLKASAKVTDHSVHESLVNRPLLTVTVHVTRCITVRKQIILSNKFSRGAVHCGQLWCTISESNHSGFKNKGAIDRHNAGFGSTISKCDMSW